MDQPDEFTLTPDARVEPKFDAYPPHIRPKVNYLRALVIQTAEETPSVMKLE